MPADSALRPVKPDTAKKSLFAYFTHDLFASFVVFLVALPLCIGIAEASLGPGTAAKGLITGIVGGLLVGMLAGCPLQVSGPAAGLTVIIIEAFKRFNGRYEDEATAYLALGAAVFIGGALQLAAGLLKAGPWFRAVSPAVIRGMLAGIGVVIAASQFHVMVHDAPKGSPLENIRTLPAAVEKGFLPLAWNRDYFTDHHLAAIIGVTTIVTILIWNALPAKIRLVPGTLVAIVAATGVEYFFAFNIDKVSVPDNLWDGVDLVVPAVSGKMLLDPDIWVTGLVIAAIASAETLLCATAVDKLAKGSRTNYDRELGAQGVGNMVCGILGVLPMTGVIVRSSANVNAGGRTRLSAILHGVWLLLFVALFAGVLNYIPRASLGAILVYIGYKLVNPWAVRDLWKVGKTEVLIYLVTIAVIVAEDLLTGVLVGIGLSAVKLLWRFSRLKIQVIDDAGGDTAEMILRGAATFIRLPQLAGALEKVPPGTHLRINLRALRYIDHACLEQLRDWGEQQKSTGGSLDIDWDSLASRFDTRNAVLGD